MRFTLLFVFLTLGELLAVTVFRETPLIAYIFKPSLMIALGLWYARFSRENGMKFNQFLGGAIFFSLLGDFFLLNPDNFLAGLGAFLIAHILYILAFYRDNAYPVFFQRDRLPWALVIGIYGAFLLAVLTPGMGKFQTPILIYAVAILTMLLTLLNRWKYVPSKSFWSVMAGGCLFVLSDSLLAVNKFVAPIAWSGLWIMATYAAGQFLIVTGAVGRR